MSHPTKHVKNYGIDIFDYGTHLNITAKDSIEDLASSNIKNKDQLLLKIIHKLKNDLKYKIDGNKVVWSTFYVDRVVKIANIHYR